MSSFCSLEILLLDLLACHFLPNPPVVFKAIRGLSQKEVTVEVVGCTGVPGAYEWHPASPELLAERQKPKKQPPWLYPFQQKRGDPRKDKDAPGGSGWHHSCVGTA
jgi:hypothetical protein